MIPMEALEGRVVPGMHRQIVESAALGNMNFLRVWGGGVYPNEEVIQLPLTRSTHDTHSGTMLVTSLEFWSFKTWYTIYPSHYLLTR